jgi:hypothetical protein
LFVVRGLCCILAIAPRANNRRGSGSGRLGVVATGGRSRARGVGGAAAAGLVVDIPIGDVASFKKARR